MGSGVLEVKLLPKQMEFVENERDPYLLYSGCRAGGKSRGLCWKVFKRARIPGAREGLFRMNESDLKGSTLKTLLEGDGELPPVIPQGMYSHNQQKREIKLHGGGEIIYRGFDKGVSAKEMGGTGGKSSMNLTGAAIDEVVEVPESLYVQLDGSVRSTVRNLPDQIYAACNPGHPSHWVARKFGLSAEYQKPEEGAWAIQTNIFENHFLNPLFVKRLANSLSGVAYDRYILGKWVGSDGLIFDRFLRSTHVTNERNPATRVVYAVDPGYTDPFVILELEVDHDKRIHVSREFYRAKTVESPGVTHDEGIQILRSMMVEGDCEVVVDSAVPELVEAMQRVGIRASASTKGAGSIETGINAVQHRLIDPGDGRPRLTVSESCVNTIREFESYEWAKNKDGWKDKPVDANNHAMDALRYGVRHIDGESGFYLAGSGVEPEKKQAVVPTFKKMREDPEWGW